MLNTSQMKDFDINKTPDAQFTIGKILDETARKDAMHFALAPMYAFDFVTQTKSGMTDESFFSCSC